MGKNEGKKSFVHRVLLLAVCVWLFVCFTRFPLCFTIIFRYTRAAQGYFVNWMDTSIVCVCVCVFLLCYAVLIRILFFASLFFIFSTKLKWISFGIHFLSVFFFTFSTKKNLCAQYDYTLHSILCVFFLSLFFSFTHLVTLAIYFVATHENKMNIFFVDKKAHITSNFHYNSIQHTHLVIPRRRKKQSILH